LSNLALALEPRRRYRDALPGATRPEVCIALDGALDQAARRRVARELIRRGNRTPVMDFASVAHVDLTEVTHLDSAGVELLNDLHLRLTAAGWLVRVTPPADIDARLSFHTAVIQGALRWV
jgi:ABC-type transporter Mla MlaB component